MSRYVLVKYGNRGMVGQGGSDLKFFNFLYCFLNVFLILLSHANVIAMIYKKDFIAESRR